MLLLPSWVPDWSVVSLGEHSPVRTVGQLIFNACGGLALSVERLADNMLKPKGIRIDAIASCGNITQGLNQSGDLCLVDTDDPLLNRGFAQLEEECSLHLVDESHDKYVAGGTKLNAFWRSLLKDVIIEVGVNEPLEARRCHDDDFERLAPWWTWLPSMELGKGTCDRNMEHYVPFQQCAVATGDDRRLLVTEEGYIGNGPAGTQPGDVIYVLAGGPEPYLLRPVADSSPKPAFTVVGDCYLHGVMDGEATEIGWQARRVAKNFTSKWFGGPKRNKATHQHHAGLHDVYLV